MRTAINLAIIRKKRILLVKKNRTWIFPGGKPNSGEFDVDCLYRELKEELPDAKMVVEKYYGSFVGKTPYKEDNLEAIVYLGKLLTNFGKPSSEINDAKFIKDFEEYNLSDITKKIINSLKKDNYL